MFVVGVLLGSLSTHYLIKPKASSRATTDSAAYPLLSRRVQSDMSSPIQINFTNLRTQLSSHLTNLGTEGSKISLYFEYLPSGTAININEKNETIAASLMKLPVVMNLYKASEEGLLNLDSTVAIKKDWLNSDYGKLYQKGEGYKVSLRDAAKLALKDSDNTALLLISAQISALPKPVSQDAINSLDVDYNLVEDGRVLISARSYSSVIKCLYFSCFNNKTNSQQMLGYLTESSFSDRLTKNLPPNVKVAHKIGTFTTRYQSDCGIVYLDKNNYLLCIMVEGNDPEASLQIADISRQVYSYIAAPNP